MISNYNVWGRSKSGPENAVGNIPDSPPDSTRGTRNSWYFGLLLLLCMIAGNNVTAQVGAYGFSQSNGTYTEITAGTLLGSTSSDDEYFTDPAVAAGFTTTAGRVGPGYPIGFNFTFNGIVYDRVGINNNGWISFGQSSLGTSAVNMNVTSAYTVLSSTSTTAPVNQRNKVAGLNADLQAQTGSTIRVETIGTAPNRTLVVQWTNYKRFSTSGTGHSLNFQIRLNETANTINIVYGSNTFNSTNNWAQVGLGGTVSTDYNSRTTTTNWNATAAATNNTASTSSSNGSNLLFNTSVTAPVSGLTFTFTPPNVCSGTPVAGTVTPATQLVCTGSTPGTLSVTGYTAATGLNFQWQQSANGVDGWADIGGATSTTYTPPAFSGTTVYYRVAVGCSGFFAYSNAVSVNPQTAPATQVSNVAIGSITNAGFNISWTSGSGGRRMVILSNSPTITDPASGTYTLPTVSSTYSGSGQQIVYDSTGSSVTVSGLTCGTTYYVKVYEYNRCGSAAPYTYFVNTSGGNAASGTTTTPALATLPVTNDFTGFTGSNLAAVAPGWYESETTGTGIVPSATSTTSDWTSSAIGGVPTAKVNLFSSSKNEWIISPRVQLTAPSRVTFKAAITNYGNTDPDPDGMQGTDDKVRVLVSTDGCGLVWTPIYTFEASTTTTLTNVLTNFTFDLSAYNGQTVQIAFQGVEGVDNTPDYDFHIADIKIEAVPSCEPVASIAISSLTASDVAFSWVPGATPAVGYEYAVTTSATAPASGTATTSTSATVSGLTANTQYYIHVRTECIDDTDFSVWETRAFKFIPGDACAYAIDLATLTSPINGTTVGAGNDYTPPCSSSNAPEMFYQINVPAGYTLSIGQTVNDYDSIHVVFYGTCASSTAITCLDGSETTPIVWTNNTGSAQVVYWVQEGWSTNSGTYTLAWTLTPPPIVVTSFAPEGACQDSLPQTTVTLTGSNFTNATSVTLNGVSTPFTVVNDTTLEVQLNSGSTEGTFVVYNAVTSGTNSTVFEITPNPAITPIIGGDVALCVGGDTADLDNVSFGGTWSSSDESIATVDADGVVTGLSNGVVTITYTVEDFGCQSSATTSITVNEPVESTNPGAVTVVTGTDAVFTVTASNATSYQWSVSTDGGDVWVDLVNDATYSGVDTNQLTINDTPDTFNEYLYMVTITGNAPCETFMSAPALLNVGDTGIASDPASVTLCSTGNGTATFTVVGSGTVDAYTWEEDQGLGFMPISDGNANGLVYSGTTTDQLTVSGITLANSGWAYRAVVVGPANGATSNPALVTVNEGVAIADQPVAASICYTGGTAQFTVNATGAVDGYQWQYSADGVNFANVANNTPVGATYSGADSATLTVSTTSATPAAGTYFYRAVIAANAPCEEVISANAQLSIFTPAITQQPAPATILAPGSVSFTVATSAPGATYQWQYATTVGGTYTNVVDSTPAGVTYSGATSASLTVTTSASVAASTARYYRVIVTSNGCSINSTPAQFTINNYCASNATNTADDDIAQVTFGPLVNPATAPSPLLNNPAAIATYTDFTGLATQSYTRGVTYPITVKQFNQEGYFVSWTKVFIDWNRDGDFADAGETYNGTGGVDGPATAPADGVVYSSNITIPMDAALGTTRMRIILNEFGTATTTANGCGTYSYGETEDYLINILPAPACSGAPVAGTISGTNQICYSGSTTLTVSGYSAGVTGISLQWYNSAGPISGATSPVYVTPTISASETYYVQVSCADSGLSSNTASYTVTVNNPSIVSTEGDSRCGSGTVTLEAVGSAGTDINWYSTATGGTPLYTGASFTTPVITQTTTYYAEASNGGSTINTARLAPAGGSGTNLTTYGQIFTLTEPAVLNSVDVVSTTGTSITITLHNATGTTAITNSGARTVPTNSTSTINLGWAIPAGTYRLSATAMTGNFIRENSGVTYPIALGTFGQITGFHSAITGGNTTTSSYYFLYNWSMTTGCASARTAVTATVTTAPALTLSTSAISYCEGQSGTVNITSNIADYDTYTWSPSAGVSGSAATGYTFNGAAGTYTLTASQSSGQLCQQIATVNVTVNPIPVIGGFSPAAPTVCSVGAPVAITALLEGTSSPATGGCLSAPNGQYPSATAGYTATACNGTTVNSITTAAWAGEYSLVNTSANTRYVFTSTGAGDYVTISDAAGTTVLAAGPSPVTYISLTAGQVRFYTHLDANCTAQNTSRTRSFVCNSLATPASWSPVEGLFTDAAGTVPYTGGSVAMVYARPSSNMQYTATTTSGAGCTDTAQVNVTVTPATVWYVDADGDGYGNGDAATTMACQQPAGYAAQSGDCNDAIAAINPGTVEILYNGFDDNCNGVIDDNNQLLSQVTPGQCGTTLTTISSLISATTFNNSTGYRFEVTNTSTGAVQVIDRPLQWFSLTMLPQYDYATTYSIRVMVQRNGVWLGYYGPACQVSSPAILDAGGAAQISASQCGITLATINTLIATNSIPNTTGYRFRVTNLTDPTAPNQVQTIDRTLHWFALTMLPTYTYGTTYLIEVAVKTNGDYSGYGSPCTISTPAVPTLTNCGAVIATSGTLISTVNKSNTTSYRFEITNLSNNIVTTIDRPNHWFSFNMVPGYAPNTQYGVRVALMTSGVYSLFGDACVITSPGAAREGDVKETIEPFKAVAYPNPFAEGFGIHITTSAEAPVSIKVYDMTGRLVEATQSEVSALENVKIGDRYPAGVYNVVVAQGENVSTLRVVKR